MSNDYLDFSAEAQIEYWGETPEKIRGKNIGPLDLAIDQRPRERLMSKGPDYLSDTELMAILLNTGIQGKNVFETAKDILELLDRSKQIPEIDEIAKIPGIGKSKACTITAMLELGKRRWGEVGSAVKHPVDIFSRVRHFADRKQEHFISLSLNGAHNVIAVRVVTVGLVNKTIVHPREVFADLIQDRASSFAVAHNHPSGKLSPSSEDDEITRRLHEAGEILGLFFLDHIIFSETSWWSYRQNRMF